jgi:hypothetical protein
VDVLLTGIKTPEEFIASASTLQAAVFAASCDLLGSAAGRRLAAACDAYSGTAGVRDAVNPVTEPLSVLPASEFTVIPLGSSPEVAADEVRAFVAAVDASALVHNGFWETLCEDVSMVDYADWEEDE